MSNLIILPNSSGNFPGEEKILGNYAGRVLALNIEKGKVFQSYKFYLGPNSPFSTVPAEADMEHIRNAVLDGRLIDVTDAHGKGLVHKTAQISAVQEVEDPSLRKVFIGVQRTNDVTMAGNPRGLFVAIPRDADEEAAMLAELQTKGRIDGKYSSQPQDVSLSGIQVSDVVSKYPANTRKETSWSLFRKGLKLLWREFTALFGK